MVGRITRWWNGWGAGIVGSLLAYCCISAIISSGPPRAAARPAQAPTPLATTVASTPGYSTRAMALLQQLTRDLVAVAMVAQSPQPHDAAWRTTMREATAAVQHTRARLQALTPPEAAATTHTALLAATSDCDQAMSHVAASLDASAAATAHELLLAGDLMQTCGEHSALVAQQLDLSDNEAAQQASLMP